MDYSLYYQGKELCLRGYSDVDWAGDLDEHKSTRYAFLLNNEAISWINKKQSYIALPTMEVEFIACSVSI